MFNQSLSLKLTKLFSECLKVVSAFQNASSPLLAISVTPTAIFAANANSKIFKSKNLNSVEKSLQLESKTAQMSSRDDGKILCLGDNEGNISLLTTKSLKKLAKVQAHSKTVNRILWEELKFYSFGNDSLVTCFKPYDH